jgi:hypothetical protein
MAEKHRLWPMGTLHENADYWISSKTESDCGFGQGSDQAELCAALAAFHSPVTYDHL